MTNEELKNMPAIIDTLLDEAITDSARQKVKDKLTEVCQLAIQALEAQPSEDTEVIKVSKGAVKARQGRFVIYDVEWFKEHFYSTEEKIYGQPKQPCEDCISREHAKQFLYYEIEHLHDDSLYDCFARIIDDMYNELPSVKPKYTDEEIDKAQAVEQAYVDKMVELAVEETKRPKGKWIEVLEHRDEFGSTWHYECSECKARSYKGIEPLERYCPNCGAYMGGEEDET